MPKIAREVAWLIAWSAAVACLAAAGCAHDEPSDSGSATYPSPLASSVAAALVAQAPVLSAKSFGSGVDVSVVRPAVLFSEARIVDGMLFVMYYPLQSDEQQIAILSGGVFHPVSLGRQFVALEFRNDNRMILAKGSDNAYAWFQLRGGSAFPIQAPASPVYGIPHHVLLDGDSCADGLPGGTSAIDDIRDHKRVSALSTAAMLRATHRVLSRAIGVYCDHFHGKNYATMDAPGLIFRIDGQDATLVTAGWIEAAGDRHLLLETQTNLIDVDAR